MSTRKLGESIYHQLSKIVWAESVFDGLKIHKIIDFLCSSFEISAFIADNRWDSWSIFAINSNTDCKFASNAAQAYICG